jgi:hypothetical protein
LTHSSHRMYPAIRRSCGRRSRPPCRSRIACRDDETAYRARMCRKRGAAPRSTYNTLATNGFEQERLFAGPSRPSRVFGANLIQRDAILIPFPRNPLLHRTSYRLAATLLQAQKRAHEQGWLSRSQRTTTGSEAQPDERFRFVRRKRACVEAESACSPSSKAGA